MKAATKAAPAPALAGASGNLNDIKSMFYKQVFNQSKSVAKQFNMNNLQPVDEGSLGDFPWYWNNAQVFNTATYNWLNKTFRYNSDGYLETDGSDFTTDYYNVITAIQYKLSAKNASDLNAEVNKNQAIVNTVVNDWTSTMGKIPSTVPNFPVPKMGYITKEILKWGATGLTLATLRTSISPLSLLPNRPMGSAKIVNDFMTYMNKTQSVATIQNQISARNGELAAVARNLQPAPTTATGSWMDVTDVKGDSEVVPGLAIKESVTTIQNALFPTGGSGASFDVELTVNKVDSSTVKVSASAGAGASGWIDWFRIGASGGASYNMFQFDQTTTKCGIGIKFDGCTPVTPSPPAYNISNNNGWWDPKPIQDAVTYNSKNDGYDFTTTQSFNFAANGDFGFLSRLLISQDPTFTLTYTNVDEHKYSSVFQQHSSWSVSFLGIPLAGGSESSYHSTYHYDKTSKTVTITMSPPQQASPVSPMNQLAYVIGAEVNWPGA